MRRVRRGGVVLGEDGCNRGDDNGAIRGEPPMGRYLGVDDPVVGRRRGDEGRDRTPDPFPPDVLSRMFKKAREPDELCRVWTDEVRFEGGGFSNNTALLVSDRSDGVKRTFDYVFLVPPPLFYS